MSSGAGASTASQRLILLTCLGGALSAGGAGAINHAVDRDIDQMMKRTADRPVASGRVSPLPPIPFGRTPGPPPPLRPDRLRQPPRRALLPDPRDPGQRAGRGALAVGPVRLRLRL